MTTEVALPRTLSKSDFALARSCDAKLYFRENRYPDTGESDPYLRLLREGSFMVEALAMAKREGGILLEYGRNAVEDFERTREYLSRETVTLFQATLLWNRRVARVDILEKRGNFVRLIEVKSKSIDGAEHMANLKDGGAGALCSTRRPHGVLTDWCPKIEDVAYQVLILERVLPGVTVQPFLVLVDKSKRSALDNLPRLFEIVRREGREGRDGRERIHTARFIGDAEQLAALDLLAEVDVSAEVAMLRDEVDEAAARYETILDAAFDPSLAVRGAKCRDCEFKLDEGDAMSGFAYCWGDLARVAPHVLELQSIGTVKEANGTPLVESLFKAGKASLFDIPEELLAKRDGTIGPQAERQLRQIRHTRSGETWLGPELRAKIERLTYPVHFIDFEVTRLALPYHARMRPYGQVVFQWSCHTVASPGAAPSHAEWLNTADVWPNKSFVLALREAIGDTAMVVAWSPFEGGRLKEIDRELVNFDASNPELGAWIADVVNSRIVDIHDWAKNDFFHSGMRGRTSIKVVLDALWKTDAAMRDQFVAWTGLEATASEDPYHALPPLEINGVRQDVREGTGAIRAYEAMMYGVEKNDEAAKSAWRKLLLQYCELDTLSMVLIFEYWRRATGVAVPPGARQPGNPQLEVMPAQL
jgi:hypothetical protein